MNKDHLKLPRIPIESYTPNKGADFMTEKLFRETVENPSGYLADGTLLRQVTTKLRQIADERLIVERS
jgi:hypothetical protein